VISPNTYEVYRIAIHLATSLSAGFQVIIPELLGRQHAGPRRFKP
jgi:hypothetical protein